MLSAHALKLFICCSLAACCGSFLAQPSYCQQAFLAEGNLLPGTLWQTDGSAEELLVYRRTANPEPAFPGAEKKLAQVAVGIDKKIYFCSGLDGYVIHLLDGRHEVSAFPGVEGQIRDLACSNEEHTIYYSVVETPKDKEPLGDGKIFRRDFQEGKATLVATIKQKDVGGNWWGTFTLKDGLIYLVTTEADSRVLTWKEGKISPVAVIRGHKVEGIAVAPDTSFQFVSGGNQVYCTADFKEITVSDTTLKHLTDVAFQANEDAARP